MLTDKKISIQIVFLILLSSVFSLPIKSLIGSRTVGGSIYSALEVGLFCFLLATIAIGDRKLRWNWLDAPACLLTLDGVILLIWSFLNHNGTYEILVEFRVHFVAIVLYFVVRYYLSHDFRLFYRIKHFIFVVLILVQVEVWFEYISSKVFGLDLMRVPWVRIVQELRTAGGSKAYSLGLGALRGIVSVFTYPHVAGLLGAVGFTLFLLEYLNSRRRIFLTLSFMCLIGAIFVAGRASLIGLLLALFYLMVKDSKVRKILIVSIAPLALFTAVLISTQLERSYFASFYSGVERFLLMTNSNMNILPFPGGSISKNIVYFMLGTGLGEHHELVARYGGYATYGIEIRLITNLLFQYGLLYLLIVGCLGIQIFKIRTSDRAVLFYKAILFQFLFSLIHYCEMLTIGAFEIFVVIYALTVSYILHSKRAHRLGFQNSRQRASAR